MSWYIWEVSLKFKRSDSQVTNLHNSHTSQASWYPLTLWWLQGLGSSGLKSCHCPVNHLLVQNVHWFRGFCFITIRTGHEGFACPTASHLYTHKNIYERSSSLVYLNNWLIQHDKSPAILKRAFLCLNTSYFHGIKMTQTATYRNSWQYVKGSLPKNIKRPHSTCLMLSQDCKIPAFPNGFEKMLITTFLRRNLCGTL